MRLVVICLCTFLISLQNIVSQKVETFTSNLNASGGVTVDERGDIFVADFGRFLGNATGDKVYRITSSGEKEVFAEGFQGASGNVFDSQGNYYQSNIAGNFVSKITPDGEISLFASSNIGGPVGLAVDKDDNIYVANCGTNEIMKVNQEGQVSLYASGAEFNCPNGLTIDEEGNLYTCNFGDGKVIKIDLNRDIEVLTTLPGGGNGHLTYANGNLYVVARCANQIYEVSLAGETRLLAGNGERGNKDGEVHSSTFNLPNGIAASPNGDTLYINDATTSFGECRSAVLNPVVMRRIVGILTGVDENSKGQPSSFNLEQNYPNPFNPSTNISYTIGKAVFVRIYIYNSLGEKISTLVNEYKQPGNFKVTWNGKSSSGTVLPSGIYLYIMNAGDYRFSNKMILLR